MSDYTKAEQAEFERLCVEVQAHQMATHPMMDSNASIAHFIMRKLREERGYDFRAAEIDRLRARLAEIDRETMQRG